MTTFGKWSDLDVARHNAKVQRKQVLDESVAIDTERESDLHDQIMAECRKRGWIYFRSRMDKKSTRALGEADFCCLLPRGLVVFVECKSRIGKLSPEQSATKAWMAKLGHEFHIARSLEDFVKICATAMSDANSKTSECYQSQNHSHSK